MVEADFPFVGEGRRSLAERVVDAFGRGANRLDILSENITSRAPCVLINAGSGSGKTRLLHEVYTRWDDLVKNQNVVHPNHSIPSSSLLFPIQFNGDVTPFGIADRNLLSDVKADVLSLIAVRVLYAYCSNRCALRFQDFVSEIVRAISRNQLDRKAVDLDWVLRSVREENGSGQETPVFLLIDEVSKVGDGNLKLLVEGVNRMLSERFYAVWTSLAVGPFSEACAGINRPIVPFTLRALRPDDMKTIIRAEFTKELNGFLERLRKWGDDREYLDFKFSVEEVLDAMAALSGGNPRFLEEVIKAYREVLTSDKQKWEPGSTPLLDSAIKARGKVVIRYGNAPSMWSNALLLSSFVSELPRDSIVTLDAAPQKLDIAMSAGGIFDGRLSGDPEECGVVNPSIPFLVMLGSEHIKAGASGFGARRFESFVAQWISLFTTARHECLYARNPILNGHTDHFKSSRQLWRCFAPLSDMKPLSLAKAGVAQLPFHGSDSMFAFKRLPQPDEYEHGVYMPEDESQEGMDAIAVLPRGRNEHQTLIAVQTKFSVMESSSSAVSEDLIRNYRACLKQMRQASWNPGTNSAFLGVVSGTMNAEDVQRFYEACPHGRLLHGEGLEVAMGPTVYPYVKHWRTLAAEVFKETRS